MLKVDQVRLEFADRVLFNDIDVFFGDDDKVGLVGKNGAGKSTLLKVILGSQPLTSGSIIKPKDFTIGYLPQDLDFDSTLSVKEEVLTAFEASRFIEKKIEEISTELTVRTDYESQAYLDLAEDLNRYSTQLGLYDIDSQDEQVERILLGLGFERKDLSRALTEFSGGWKMRVALSKILLSKPNLILLDEPTNHLDIESVEWLETYLKNYSGGVILISHDRMFLDRVTNRTVELINGKIFDYPVSYTKFVDMRGEVIQQQRDARKNQEREIKQTEALINKFRAKASKATFAQSLIKKLDKMEIIEIDEEENSSMKFRFPPAPRSGKMVVEAQELTKNYGEKTIFSNLDFEIIRNDKVALVGKNGVGKTTLTRVIAGITPYQGTCQEGAQVDLGYYSQNQSEELPMKSTVLEVIEKEATGDMTSKVRSLLGAFMFQGDDVYKQVSVLSGGEKARLALCKLLLHRYNFLILDEPTNHLDMRSKDVLKEALMQFDGTLLVVSHDRDFLKGLTDKVMEIKNGEMTVFPGDISDFLARKKAESIREFERVKQEKPKAAKPKERISEKDKWQLSKRVTSLEKEIETLESKLDDLKAQAQILDFSDHEKVRKNMDEIKSTEQKLGEKMLSWEDASEKLNAV